MSQEASRAEVRQSGEYWEVNLGGKWYRYQSEADAREAAWVPVLLQQARGGKSSHEFADSLERAGQAMLRNGHKSVGQRELLDRAKKMREALPKQW